MSDLQRLFEATAKKEAAKNLYNYAGANLELMTIRHRFAEIRSQHEPLASIIGDTGTTREQLIQAVRYVMRGRADV